MKKPRLLVVEDEAIVAIDLGQTLQSLGYEVVATVGTGEEALRLIENELPDLVLMDIHLRGELDGIQVAERIQTSLRTPVIYLSAFSDANTLSRAKLTEPYGYIMKSFDHNDLHSTIEMALYRHNIEKKVAESEKLLSTTFAAISDGVLTCDPDGRVRLINAAARRMLGLEAEEEINQKIFRLPVARENPFNEEPPDPFSLPVHAIEGSLSGRYLISTPAGRFPVVRTISPILGEREDLTGFVYILRNIAEEFRVREMQARLASIVETSQDAIIGSTPGGTIISWNSGAARLFGYCKEEVEGKNLSLLVPDFYPNEIPQMLDRIKNGEVIDDYETLRRTRQGEVLDMSVKISAIRDSGGTLLAVSHIARDVSKRKQLEKEILEIEDRERSRIGQDLHDSLGQKLTGILLRLKAHELTIRKQQCSQTARDVQEIQSLVRGAVEQTREMAKGLIPLTLQTNGLVEALQELSLYFQSMYGTAVTFRTSGFDARLSPTIELQLYHIAQEALNNAIKHSGSSVIEVSLDRDTTEAVLAISDTGRGIPPEPGEGLGLRIMQYRANMVSGYLSILANEPTGSRIVCRVPISAWKGRKQ